MKKSYQRRKESEEISNSIVKLQAHIRGYLVRKEMKNRIQWCSRQELFALKIQVGVFPLFFLRIFKKFIFRIGGVVFCFKGDGLPLLRQSENS